MSAICATKEVIKAPHIPATKFWWIAIIGDGHSPSASAYTVDQVSKLRIRSVPGSVAWVSNAPGWFKSDFDALYGFNTKADQQRACRVLEDETQQSRFAAPVIVARKERMHTLPEKIQTAFARGRVTYLEDHQG